MLRMRRLVTRAIAWALACAAAKAHELFGVSYTTGEFFRVSSMDGSLVVLGSVGAGQLSALEFAPDGTLWAIRGGHLPSLHTLDPATGAPLTSVSIGLAFLQEGGLAFSPSGTAYAASETNSGVPQLITIDLNTGVATIVGSLGAGRDVNGLGWRSDGKLVALDAGTQSLLVLDPSNAAVLSAFPLAPALGTYGGLALRGSTGYFVTASMSAPGPGSSQLVRFDPFTGAHAVVGALALPAGASLGGLAWRAYATQSVYCTSGTTSNGCAASMTATGAASASAPNGFVLRANGVEGQRSGLVMYGVTGRAALPWAGGSSSFLCVRPPLQRTVAQSSGGTPLACDGVLALDWNAFRVANPSALGASFVPGSVLDAQAWFRDPPSPKTSSLSDALEFVLNP